MKGKGTLRTIKVAFPAALWRCGALVATGSRCETWAFVLALTPALGRSADGFSLLCPTRNET